MHSVWEKLNPPYEIVRQMCEHDVSTVGEDYVRRCAAPAYWRHSWRTQDMPESHHGYYCETHALEHGLSNYDLPDQQELLRIEAQAQELFVPYGGAPGEIVEEDEDEEEGEDYGAYFDNQERCPRCNENHPPPICNPAGFREED